MATQKGKFSKRRYSKKSMRNKSKSKQYRSKAFKTDTKNWKLSTSKSYLYSDQNGLMKFTCPGALLNVKECDVSGFYPAGSNLKSIGGAFAFQFDSALLASKLSTMFDRYKINGVRVKFIPTFNYNSTATGGTLPIIKIIHDYDDNVVPASSEAIWSRVGKEYRLDRPISMFIRPRVKTLDNFALSVGQSTSTITGNTIHKSQWFDMANSSTRSIPHLGIKFAIRDFYSPTGANNTNMINIECTYYCSTKEQLNTGVSVNDDVDEEKDTSTLPSEPNKTVEYQA